MVPKVWREILFNLGLPKEGATCVVRSNQGSIFFFCNLMKLRQIGSANEYQRDFDRLLTTTKTLMEDK